MTDTGKYKAGLEHIAARGCEYGEDDNCFKVAREFCRSCFAQLLLKEPVRRVRLLSPEDVERMAEMEAQGMKHADISDKFRVSQSSVYIALRARRKP